MSILIRGMEMPTSCNECRFAVDGWCYACVPESEDERKRITTNYCPLIEIPPHGDLIGRDALMELYADTDDMPLGNMKVPIAVIRQNIMDAPTIIEGDYVLCKDTGGNVEEWMLSMARRAEEGE